MSNDHEQKVTIFSRIGIRIKLLVAGLVAAAGFLFVVLFNRRGSQIEMLKHELGVIRSEIEIEKASEDILENNGKISYLKKKEEELKRKIWEIDNRESSGDVSNEELDKFFDDRGF